MKFEPGNSYGKGRPKGSTNKIVQESRDLLTSILKGEIEKVGDYLNSIKTPRAKIDALTKLLPFCLPRLSSGDLNVEMEAPAYPVDFSQLSEPALMEVLKLMEANENSEGV